MANWHYYNEKREKIGPFEGKVLKQLVQQGIITPETFIEDPTGRTGLAKDVKGLKFAAASSVSENPSTIAVPLPPNQPVSSMPRNDAQNSMSGYFYTNENGNKYGPMTEQRLQTLVERGAITQLTLLETESGQQTFAGRIPGLNFNNAPKELSCTNLFCTNCGISIPEQADTCMACGARPTGHKKFCRQCGVALNPEQVVCLKCGVAVTTTSAPSPVSRSEDSRQILYEGKANYCSGIFSCFGQLTLTSDTLTFKAESGITSNPFLIIPLKQCVSVTTCYNFFPINIIPSGLRIVTKSGEEGYFNVNGRKTWVKKIQEAIALKQAVEMETGTDAPSEVFKNQPGKINGIIIVVVLAFVLIFLVPIPHAKCKGRGCHGCNKGIITVWKYVND